MPEPTTIRAGDSLYWTAGPYKLPDGTTATPDGGWTLTYRLYSSDGTAQVAADALDGTRWAVSVPAATTAAWATGVWRWTAQVSAGTDRYTVAEGTWTVTPDPATAGPTDARSHARRVLDAIEAVIEGRASQDQMAYQIAGRRLDRTPLPDLLLLRDRYRAEVLREEQAERLARGLGVSGLVKVRF